MYALSAIALFFPLKRATFTENNFLQNGKCNNELKVTPLTKFAKRSLIKLALDGNTLYSLLKV